ncbi:hypothetical protein B0H67DRAFT_587785 [Lasiosphaeris hirsuta]|uniref:Uncharacterized protein n=1 Tax=Lasiosphaeris hirsuta TaxID=260670 RepID=A0AA40A1H6_9PEZI|nr:hypothetical protein B0H67DRAFT_587785 [Lasiosphaeris hirsuta]
MLLLLLPSVLTVFTDEFTNSTAVQVTASYFFFNLAPSARLLPPVRPMRRNVSNYGKEQFRGGIHPGSLYPCPPAAAPQIWSPFPAAGDGIGLSAPILWAACVPAALLGRPSAASHW